MEASAAERSHDPFNEPHRHLSYHPHSYHASVYFSIILITVFFPEMKWTAKKRILLTIPLSNRFLELRFGRGGKWEGGRVAALKWWWWGGGLEGVSVCGYGWIVLFGDY